MENQIIKANDIFTSEHLKLFLKDVNEEDEINIYVPNNDVLFFSNKKDLKKTIKKFDKILIEDDYEILFISNDNLLEINGKDLKNILLKNDKNKYENLNDLFSKIEKENKNKLIRVFSGILNEDNSDVNNIKCIDGTKKEVIEFINKNYAINEIKCNFTNKSVFHIPIKYKENKIENWKTLKELEEEGVIEL